MHLLRDSLGRCEIVGDDDFERSMKAPPSAMLHGISHASKGTPVIIKFDREIDAYGDFWIAFVALAHGGPGDFVTFGSRYSEDIQPMVDDFVKRHGLVVASKTFTPAAKGQRAKDIETTS
jgi:hypothetical protein